MTQQDTYHGRHGGHGLMVGLDYLGSLFRP